MGGRTFSALVFLLYFCLLFGLKMEENVSTTCVSTTFNEWRLQNGDLCRVFLKMNGNSTSWFRGAVDVYDLVDIRIKTLQSQEMEGRRSSISNAGFVDEHN